MFDGVSRLLLEGIPCFNQYGVHVVSYKLCHPILHHPHTLQCIVERLQFGILAILIGVVVDVVACIQYKGLDVFEHHLS